MDTQVCSGIVTLSGAQAMADSVINTWLLGLPRLDVFLFKNNLTVNYATQLSDFTECDFDNYARGSITSFNGAPFTDQAGRVYGVSNLQTWFSTGGVANTAYGLGVISDSNGTQATGTATTAANAVTGVTITNGGTQYGLPPKITFSGGGGSGAKAHAVLTNGVVTSVVIDAGGSAYATPPTVTFEKPQLLIQAFTFNSPQPMLSGNGIAAVVEVFLPFAQGATS